VGGGGGFISVLVLYCFEESDLSRARNPMMLERPFKLAVFKKISYTRQFPINPAALGGMTTYLE
jgi:hypothetical protein